jgi:hypothetical protein
MKNEWQKRFGARRREIDRKILAEAELAIAREEWLKREMREELEFERQKREGLK